MFLPAFFFVYDSRRSVNPPVKSFDLVLVGVHFLLRLRAVEEGQYSACMLTRIRFGCKEYHVHCLEMDDCAIFTAEARRKSSNVAHSIF